MTVFNFGENGVVTPDADGRYRNGFYGSELPDGVSEAEAIRQWLVPEMLIRRRCDDCPPLGELERCPSCDLVWARIERLCGLAEQNQEGRSDESL